MKKRILSTHNFYIFLGALLPVLFMSKCSPFYPLNDWFDINQIFTVGKGMVHGKVLYMDLMDHKGPYVFSMASMAYLIAHRSFLGYFIFEVINLFVFSFYTEKMIRLYLPEQKNVVWILPVLCAVIVSSTGFQHGGSVEEFSLGILSYALYSMMYLLRGNLSERDRLLFCNGFLAGILFWSKFSMLGLYIIWVIFYFLFVDRRIIHNILLFGGGVIGATIPWVIYFGFHHAIGDWLMVYLYQNIFSYGKIQSRSLLRIVFSAVRCLKEYLLYRGNIAVLLFLLLGLLFLFLPNKLNGMSLRERICVLMMAVTMVLGVYAGGFDFGYYGLILCVFLGIGALTILLAERKINAILETACQKDMNGLWTVTHLVLNIFVLIIAFWRSDNTYLFGADKKSMPQYVFAEVIEQAPDDRQVVLNYGFLDAGVYTVLDQVPQMRYFSTSNSEYERILEIQNGYLEQEIPDFVITYYPTEVEETEIVQKPVLQEHYHLITWRYHFMEGEIRTYALWGKND